MNIPTLKKRDDSNKQKLMDDIILDKIGNKQDENSLNDQ
jgi:hypothetical protein